MSGSGAPLTQTPPQPRCRRRCFCFRCPCDCFSLPRCRLRCVCIRFSFVCFILPRCRRLCFCFRLSFVCFSLPRCRERCLFFVRVSFVGVNPPPLSHALCFYFRFFTCVRLLPQALFLFSLFSLFLLAPLPQAFLRSPYSLVYSSMTRCRGRCFFRVAFVALACPVAAGVVFVFSFLICSF